MDYEIENLIAAALNEDCADSDITSNTCLDDQEITASFLLKEDARLAGILFIAKIFQKIDPMVRVDILAKDGNDYLKGAILAKIQGPARSILKAERSALNLVQHLSGIATYTAKCVDAIKDFPCDILDTRKTLPGMRQLQKYAVRMGGGKNHRLNLAELFLIKNNHLAALEKTHPNPILEAIARARKASKTTAIEIEVGSFEQLDLALQAKADRIMLDNMTLDEIKVCVERAQGRVYLEASGGIDLLKVKDYAACGVNGISIGALTHTVKAIDISLRIER